MREREREREREKREKERERERATATNIRLATRPGNDYEQMQIMYINMCINRNRDIPNIIYMDIYNCDTAQLNFRAFVTSLLSAYLCFPSQFCPCLLCTCASDRDRDSLSIWQKKQIAPYSSRENFHMHMYIYMFTYVFNFNVFYFFNISS